MRATFCWLPVERSAILRDRSASSRSARIGHPALVDAAAQVGEVAQQLRPGEVGVEGVLGWHVADVPPDLDAVGHAVEAQDGGATPRREDEVQERPDGRRLAGAVGPEEAEDLAALDLQVEVLDGMDVAVVLGQALRQDGGRWRALAHVVHRPTALPGVGRSGRIDPEGLPSRPGLTVRWLSRSRAGWRGHRRLGTSAEKPAGIAGRQDADRHPAPTRLRQDLVHDRQPAGGAGPDDQVAAGPGDVLRHRERCVTEARLMRLARASCCASGRVPRR